MPYEIISQGVTIVIPTSGTKNWATTLKNSTWVKLSAHDHSGSGNGSKLGSSAFQANSVNKAALAKNVGEYQFDDTAAASVAIDWDQGRVHRIDATAAVVDVDIDLSAANPIEGGVYKLILTASAANKFSISGATVKWPQGEDPMEVSGYFLSQEAGLIDIIDLYYDGTNYLASWNVDFS